MIKGEQSVKEHKDGVRDAEFVLGERRQALELPHNVVGKESHRATRKRRQAFEVGRTMLPQQVTHNRKQRRVADLASRIAVLVVLNDGLRTRSGNNAVRPRTEKRIASDLLAALYRFQEKRMRLIGRDAQKCRDRRLQVGADGLADRDQRCRFSKAQEFFAIGMQHGTAIIGCGYEGNATPPAARAMSLPADSAATYTEPFASAGALCFPAAISHCPRALPNALDRCSERPMTTLTPVSLEQEINPWEAQAARFDLAAQKLN